MRQLVETLKSTFNAKLIASVALPLAAIAIGRLVPILRIGTREIAIVLMIVLMSALILIPSDRMLQWGFKLWIITFAFGWRTIYFTQNLNIHPSEVIAFLLFFAFLARSIIKHTELDFSLPIALSLFMLTAVFGTFTGFVNLVPADVVIEEFKSFVQIILAYYIVRWSIKTGREWESATHWAIAVAVYIGLLGLMDYFVPNISRAISGQQDIETLYAAQSFGGYTFSRVGFIFFGNFSAGFVIFAFLGFTVHFVLTRFGKGANGLEQISLIAMLLIQIAGIYLSGYRGLWYAVAFFVIVYALFQKRAWGLLGVGLLALPLLPVDFINRFQSVFNLEFADSSQYDRINRATVAFNQFLQAPLMGVGWGGSGYVHSDFIQIAADSGFFGILLFLIWVAGILWQLFRLTRVSGWICRYAGLLFAMVCALLFVLAGEGLYVFVQLVIPIWFLFAMCSKLSELASESDASDQGS